MRCGGGRGGGDSWSICQDPADHSSLQLGALFLYTLLIKSPSESGCHMRDVVYLGWPIAPLFMRIRVERMRKNTGSAESQFPHSCVCERIILWWVCLFCWRKYVDLWPILGIYKSLTDTWMWKLGLRPRYSQKRNTWVGFSLQCRLHSTYAGKPVRQTYAGVSSIQHSGPMNFATGCTVQ